MGAQLERMLEPSDSSKISDYVAGLLTAYTLFPEATIDALSRSNPYTRLRFELKRRGMTNKALAQETGLHESAIARAFTRKSGLEKHWNAIARAVGTEPRWLVEGHDDTIRNVNEWPSPVLGTLDAKLHATLTKAPRFASVSVAGFIEATDDVPQFQIKKGNLLIVAQITPVPNALIVVCLKDGSGRLGRLMEVRDSASSTPAADLVLSDGEGRVILIKKSEIANTYLVDGIIFGHQFASASSEQDSLALALASVRKQKLPKLDTKPSANQSKP
ncbi:MAG: helix-turn-helix transcriptional regulator [Actinomycetes bacterium]